MRLTCELGETVCFLVHLHFLILYHIRENNYYRKFKMKNAFLSKQLSFSLGGGAAVLRIQDQLSRTLRVPKLLQLRAADAPVPAPPPNNHAPRPTTPTIAGHAPGAAVGPSSAVLGGDRETRRGSRAGGNRQSGETPSPQHQHSGAVGRPPREARCPVMPAARPAALTRKPGPNGHRAAPQPRPNRQPWLRRRGSRRVGGEARAARSQHTARAPSGAAWAGGSARGEAGARLPRSRAPSARDAQTAAQVGAGPAACSDRPPRLRTPRPVAKLHDARQERGPLLGWTCGPPVNRYFLTLFYPSRSYCSHIPFGTNGSILWVFLTWSCDFSLCI